MVLGAQTHALFAQLDQFSQWVMCGNEIARNHRKHEFWAYSSGVGMFVAKSAGMVPGAQTHALYAQPDHFSQWVTCGNEMARNHPKHEFWT